MNEVIAKSYWRSIKRGTRTIEDVPPELKEAVLELDRQAGEESMGLSSGEEDEE